MIVDAEHQEIKREDRGTYSSAPPEFGDWTLNIERVITHTRDFPANPIWHVDRLDITPFPVWGCR
jgi:hypothetical protein